VAVGVDHGGSERGRISVVKLVRKGSQWLRTSDALVARWLRAAHAALLGEMPVLAAGTALFAIIAVVPTLAAAVAIYGLVADPFQIQNEIRGLHQVLPVEVVRFIGDQLERQAQRSSGELGLQLGVSVGLALFSARGSARALTDALNRAYRVRDLRSSLARLGLSLSMAVFTLVGLMTMFAVLVVLPALAGWINHDYISAALWLRWPALLGLVFLSLTFLYRYVPSPRPLGRPSRPMPVGRSTCLIARSVTSAYRVRGSRRSCSCSCRGCSACGSTTSRTPSSSTARSVASSSRSSGFICRR
jgi:membrane protein